MTLNKVTDIIAESANGRFDRDDIYNVLKSDKIRYCTGNYKPSVKEKIAGKILEAGKILWYENRTIDGESCVAIYTIRDERNKLLNYLVKGLKEKGVKPIQ